MATDIPEPTWAELLGRENWAGLLDPLHPSLRSLILRCGDLVQATYDAFNNDKNSPYCGASRYGKASFFRKVMLDNPDHYNAAAFLYATAKISVPEALILHSLSREAWDRESNWIGYVAVTSDTRSRELGRREIYVVWRGTSRDMEWINVFGARQVDASALLSAKSVQELNTENNRDESSSSEEEEDSRKPKVMSGWLTIYTSDDPNSRFTRTSARTQFLSHVKSLLQRYSSENPSVVIVGHSLGATLSVVSAFDLVENGVTEVPVTAIVFGSPQVGNKAFNERLNKFGNLKVLHVRNVIDLIVHYPGKLLGYEYTGTELVIDTRKSGSLKESKNPGDWHNLQGMLHVVAGWSGKNKEFELKVKRSLALVNKSCDFLKDEYGVPGSWWIEKNKGMVKMEDGEWLLDAPHEEDVPVPENI